MKRFPLFISLENKTCIVVGGGTVATHRIKILLQFGAKVTVISTAIGEELTELAKEGKVMVKLKTFHTGMLQDALLVLACTDQRAVNKCVYEEAVKQNCFVNVCDDPEHSTFHFPAVITREDLVIGINSDGAFPAFIKQLKQKIEHILPKGIGNRLKQAKETRGQMDLTDKKAIEKICQKLWNESEE